MGSTVSISLYQQSLRTYADARQRLRVLLSAVQQVTDSFTGWEKLDPRGVNGSLESALPKLPTPDDIRAAIKAWKDAAAAMHTNWEHIVGDDLVGLVPPERFDPDAWLNLTE